MKKSIMIMTALIAGTTQHMMHADREVKKDVIVINLNFKDAITIKTGLIKKITLEANPTGDNPKSVGIVNLSVGSEMKIIATTKNPSNPIQDETYVRLHASDNVFSVKVSGPEGARFFNVDPINRKHNNTVFNKYPFFREPEYQQYGNLTPEA
jgi:sporulation-control protein spo0M